MPFLWTIDTVDVNSKTPSEPNGHPPLVEEDELYFISTKKAIHLSSIGGLLCAIHVLEPLIVLKY